MLQMKIVTLAYKDFIRDSGIKIEESPLNQLHVTVRKVFDSWNTFVLANGSSLMRHFRFKHHAFGLYPFGIDP